MDGRLSLNHFNNNCNQLKEDLKVRFEIGDWLVVPSRYFCGSNVHTYKYFVVVGIQDQDHIHNQRTLLVLRSLLLEREFVCMQLLALLLLVWSESPFNST